MNCVFLECYDNEIKKVYYLALLLLSYSDSIDLRVDPPINDQLLKQYTVCEKNRYRQCRIQGYPKICKLFNNLKLLPSEEYL